MTSAGPGPVGCRATTSSAPRAPCCARSSAHSIRHAWSRSLMSSWRRETDDGSVWPAAVGPQCPGDRLGAMHQPSGSRGIAAAFATALILAACGSESQSPSESSQTAIAEPSPAQPSASPSAGGSIDPAPAEPVAHPDEILLRMDITPDSVAPNPQGLGGAGWFAPGPDFTLYA